VKGFLRNSASWAGGLTPGPSPEEWGVGFAWVGELRPHPLPLSRGEGSWFCLGGGNEGVSTRIFQVEIFKRTRTAALQCRNYSKVLEERGTRTMPRHLPMPGARICFDERCFLNILFQEILVFVFLCISAQIFDTCPELFGKLRFGSMPEASGEKRFRRAQPNEKLP